MKFAHICFLSVSKIIEVHIADKNDNTPYFERDLYEAEVDENEDMGHTVLVINAQDKDACEYKVLLVFLFSIAVTIVSLLHCQNIQLQDLVTKSPEEISMEHFLWMKPPAPSASSDHRITRPARGYKIGILVAFCLLKVFLILV